MNIGCATVVIPAHDEAVVIGRTLGALLAQALPGEFDVVVVANGCSDDTAAVVRRDFPCVQVLELAEGSKTAALNAGLDIALPGPVLLLDADLVLTTTAARALIGAAREPGIEAAIAAMDIDPSGVRRGVRLFYEAWLQHPYFDGGKFAAAYALSAAGRARLGRFPSVTADDEYLARLIPADRVRSAAAARFVVSPPRTLSALVAVRTRSRRGTRALGGATIAGASRTHLARLLMQPRLWPAAVVYGAVTVLARLRAQLAPSARWERDLTSRAPGAGA